MALNKAKITKDAEKYIRKNQIDKAIGEYERWLKENPKDWNTLRQVADLNARIGKNSEAIRKYNIVADQYRRDGFNVRAIATHKLILRLDPDNELAMRNLAELHVEQGFLMEAKHQYQSLIDLYTKMNWHDRTEDIFQQFTEVDPLDLKVRYKFAAFLHKRGKRAKAIAEYIGIADEFINQGMVEEAERILEKGAEIDVASVAFSIKWAQIALLKGNYKKSVEILVDAECTNPDNLEILVTLGEAYLAAGNTGEAAKSFKHLSELQPDNPENVIRLADLKIMQSELDEALEQLTPLVERMVANEEALKAADVLQRVLSKEPRHIPTLLKLIEVHTKLKQKSGQIFAYDSLFEAYNQAGNFEKAMQVAEQLIKLEPEKNKHKDRLGFLKAQLTAPAATELPQLASVSTPAASEIGGQDLPEMLVGADPAMLHSEINFGSGGIISETIEVEFEKVIESGVNELTTIGATEEELVDEDLAVSMREEKSVVKSQFERKSVLDNGEVEDFLIDTPSEKTVQEWPGVLPPEQTVEGTLPGSSAVGEDIDRVSVIEEFSHPAQVDEVSGGYKENTKHVRSKADESFADLDEQLVEEAFSIFGVDSVEVDKVKAPVIDPVLDSLFKEFRKGVEKQLGSEDYETRYELGIAYKEMGLIDEAIAEFELAANGEVRRFECCSMLGLCFVDKGMHDIAIKWLGAGLDISGRCEEEYNGLRYDIAQAYEALNQLEHALEHYIEIYFIDTRFRDVKDKLRELQSVRK